MQLFTKFFKCNIYTTQIHHNNSYRKYMRLERNIHKHERRSNLIGYASVLGSSKPKVHN